MDNNISQLKEKYQGKSNAGGNTIISRASSAASVPERTLRKAAEGGPVNPKTGELQYVPTGRLNPVSGAPRITKGSKMEFAKDARDLLSSKTNPQPMEEVYASHANAMKALANEARRLAHPDNLKMPKQNKQARTLYAKEVASLEAKLKIAQRNAPIERRAQNIAGARAKARIDADPTLDKDEIKKIKFAELERARLATGASKVKIGSDDSPITLREWDAIQAGAVSSSRLEKILANADIDRVRELATPKVRTSLTPGQIARARQLAATNKPMTEIAQLLGIPATTLRDNLANS